MTQMLPEEPTTLSVFGKVEKVQLAFFMSLWKRPNHQVPEKNIG